MMDTHHGFDEEDDADQVVERTHIFRNEEVEETFASPPGTLLPHPSCCLVLAATFCGGFTIALLMVVVVAAFLINYGVFINHGGGPNNNGIPYYSTYTTHESEGFVQRGTILFGLREGYNDDNADGVIHSFQDVQKVVMEWMDGRRIRNETIIPGALRNETLIYPHHGHYIQVEHAAIFVGVVRPDRRIAPAAAADVDDQEVLQVLDTLRNMTEGICVPLGQEICFYEYQDVEYRWTNEALLRRRRELLLAQPDL